jgi:hypothetical protein
LISPTKKIPNLISFTKKTLATIRKDKEKMRVREKKEGGGERENLEKKIKHKREKRKERRETSHLLPRKNLTHISLISLPHWISPNHHHSSHHNNNPNLLLISPNHLANFSSLLLSKKHEKLKKKN